VGANYRDLIPESGDQVYAQDDGRGFVVYEAGAEPPLRGPVTIATAFVLYIPEDFRIVFRRAVAAVDSRVWTTEEEKAREELALELFNASFFEASVYARFLTLSAAIEALLPYPERSPASLEHIGKLVEQTRQSAELTTEEKQSLCSTMEQQLRRESVGKMARALIRERMGDRSAIWGKSKHAVQFFTACYGTRSNLIHANLPRPSREEVKALCSRLEMFVSHLLCPSLWESAS
jgi:hypothetical protein